MDKKVYADGNVTVWVVPYSAIDDLDNISPDEINTNGLDISDALAWADTTLPVVAASDDVDDRSIRDKGNATSRGASNYSASLTLFYPGDLDDTNSIFRKAWDVFRTTRVPLVLVIRVGQGETGEASPAEEGQIYNAFYMLNSTYRNSTEGDNSVKYSVGFMTQGSMRVNGIFTDGAGELEITNAPASVAAGESVPLRAESYGHRIGRALRWRSSDTSVASVSRSGVVTGVGTGSATITASYDGLEDATASVTVA